MKILKFYKQFFEEAKKVDLITILLFLLFAFFAGGIVIGIVEIATKYAISSPIGFLKIIGSIVIGIPTFYFVQEFFEDDKK